MTGRIRVLVSLTRPRARGIRCRTIRHTARRSSASCRATAPGRFPRPHVTGSSTTCRSTRPSRSRAPRQRARARRDPDRAREQPRIAGSGATYARRRRAGYDTRSRARRSWRHERLLLPRRAPRGAARAIDLRLHATEGAHLRQRSRQAARPRRRDVEHTGRRGRADTRRADPALALARRLQGREEAGAEASGERRLPAGLTTPAGCERDAPRLVHAATCAARSRSPLRSRSCARTGFCPRDDCQAALARAISRR